MSLVQAEGRDAALDRVVRKIVTHCALRVDGLPAAEHAARAALAGRMLDAAGGYDTAVDLTDATFAEGIFADELRQLSLNK